MAKALGRRHWLRQRKVPTITCEPILVANVCGEGLMNLSVKLGHRVGCGCTNALLPAYLAEMLGSGSMHLALP